MENRVQKFKSTTVGRNLLSPDFCIESHVLEKYSFELLSCKAEGYTNDDRQTDR